MPCSAVFVFIGAEPSAEWLPAEIARDANRLSADRHRRRPFRTCGRAPIATLARWRRRVPGVLAAGRHPLRLDQARRLRGRRRLAGGDLRPSIAVDHPLTRMLE